MKQTLAGILFVFLFFPSTAQNKYWISFADKGTQSFSPHAYFSERTITQRIAHHIPLVDSTDYPVNPEYVCSVTLIADSISWQSRWLNGIAVYASEEKIEQIRMLNFVSNITAMNSVISIASYSNKTTDKLTSGDISLLKFQTQRMQGDTFALRNIDGKGIRIAVFDAGFPGVDKHEAFQHIRESKQIVATYDFVSKNEKVYDNHWHGTATLSCIGGKSGNLNIGLATGSEYLLARTEKSFCEPFSEEENWVAAAEWADKNGVNIISSSLGYTYHRYFNNEMDGKNSLVARAATIAASKGILVVNAVGNDGGNSWKTVNTPADADSVLTVGGTDPQTDMKIYFSSYGPTSDGRLKPNVCSLGEVIAANKKGLTRVSGTSFSTPLIAGFAACAWQANPQWTCMKLFDELEKASHLYPYFDYAHGFGIPQATNIIKEKEEQEQTFDFVIINNDIKIILREEYSYPQTESALGYSSRRNFYYKVEDGEGRLKRYFVLIADRKEMLHFLAEDFQAGDVLTVHFEGFTSSIDFPEITK